MFLNKADAIRSVPIIPMKDSWMEWGDWMDGLVGKGLNGIQRFGWFVVVGVVLLASVWNKWKKVVEERFHGDKERKERLDRQMKEARERQIEEWEQEFRSSKVEPSKKKPTPLRSSVAKRRPISRDNRGNGGGSYVPSVANRYPSQFGSGGG